MPAHTIAHDGTVNALDDAVERLCDASRYSEALRLVDASPDDATVAAQRLTLRGEILLRWGRFREAQEHLAAAHDRGGLTGARVCVGLARASLGIMDAEGALTWAVGAVASAPDSFNSNFVHALALDGVGQRDAAASAYAAALSHKPDAAECLIRLAANLVDRGDSANAEQRARAALEIAPQSVRAWAALSSALERQGRLDEALPAAWRAAALAHEDPEFGEALTNAPLIQWKMGQHEEALRSYAHGLSRSPSVRAHFGFALALLTCGRLREGWTQYEFRWLVPPHAQGRPAFRRPAWSGQDLRGKSILLCSEFGFGDTLQFIRYAPLLKALGATVLLGSTMELADLAGRIPGIDHVIRPGESIPAFDYFSYLMSLPKVFGTELDSIPAPLSYVHPAPSRVDTWRNRIGADGQLRVGIVWAGNPAHLNDANRSIPLEALRSLFDLPGVRFISLQVRPSDADRRALGECNVENLGPDLLDFSDTAAAMLALDLVVSVDTAAVHLAGALGTPVWAMLPEPAEFRWLTAREDCPWYPSMRLFRQKRPGDWAEVIERVRASLRRQLDNRPAPAGLRRAAFDSTNVRWPIPAEPIPASNRHIAEIVQTRYGLLQFLPDAGDIGEALDHYGEWRQPQLEVVLRRLQPGCVIVEVGADVGAHAIALAQALDESGHLFLYESNLTLRQILRQNLAANAARNVTLMRRTLGGPTLAKGSCLGTADPSDETEALSRETLDDLGLKRLDWLKINVRADALAVLMGARSTLALLRPCLLIDAQSDADVDACVAGLKPLGYRCWCNESSLFNPDNFNNRADDAFAGRKALALLATPDDAGARGAIADYTEL